MSIKNRCKNKMQKTTVTVVRNIPHRYVIFYMMMTSDAIHLFLGTKKKDKERERGCLISFFRNPNFFLKRETSILDNEYRNIASPSIVSLHSKMKQSKSSCRGFVARSKSIRIACLVDTTDKSFFTTSRSCA